MTVIYLLLPLSLLVVAGFVAAFFWAVRRGQFDDLETPALRVLTEDAPAAAVVPGRGAGSENDSASGSDSGNCRSVDTAVTATAGTASDSEQPHPAPGGGERSGARSLSE